MLIKYSEGCLHSPFLLNKKLSLKLPWTLVDIFERLFLYDEHKTIQFKVILNIEKQQILTSAELKPAC